MDTLLSKDSSKFYGIDTSRVLIDNGKNGEQTYTYTATENCIAICGMGVGGVVSSDVKINGIVIYDAPKENGAIAPRAFSVPLCIGDTISVHGYQNSLKVFGIK